MQNGITLASFNNIAVICTNPNIEICQLNLNVPSSTNGFSDYTQLNNLAYIMSFNASTRTITVQFNTLDLTSINMNITASDYGSGSGLCSSTLTSSAGVFNCIIPNSFGNGTINVILYGSGSAVSQAIYMITRSPASIFGNDALIYVMILLITLVFMFITDTKGMLVALVIGLVVLVGLNIFVVGSIISTTSSIMWLVIAISTVIFKLAQRSREGA